MIVRETSNRVIGTSNRVRRTNDERLAIELELVVLVIECYSKLPLVVRQVHFDPARTPQALVVLRYSPVTYPNSYSLDRELAGLSGTIETGVTPSISSHALQMTSG